jgi:hypothetical protein
MCESRDRSGFDCERWTERREICDWYGGGRVPRERALAVGPGGISMCLRTRLGWEMSAFSKYGAR